MSKSTPETRVCIGPVRISFANVWEPKKTLNSDKLKYSVQVLIPKKEKAMIAEVKKAINAAAQQGMETKFKGKNPKQISGFRWALRDGDKDGGDNDAAKGHYFINFSSDNAPGIVDKNRKPILDKDEVYSGCYCYITGNFYPFNEGGGKGIAAGLNNILKFKDGERLSGRPSAESDFADLDIEEDDDDLAFLEDEDEDDDDMSWLK